MYEMKQGFFWGGDCGFPIFMFVGKNILLNKSYLREDTQKIAFY